MFVIGADIVFVCDDDFNILENGAIAYENNVIIEIGNFSVLCKKYKDCIFSYYKDCILLPSLINSHIHFEFSKHENIFRYGSFDLWLDSVISNRIDILSDSEVAIKEAIQVQKENGVGIVCAISSYDDDLSLLLDSKLKVIFAIETIGSNQFEFLDQVERLSLRLDNIMGYKSQFFVPALAIHSPYSVHYDLAKYIISLAQKFNLLVSTHFLESRFELEWLRRGEGFFRDFYKKHFNVQATPAFSPESFLDLFFDVRALFTHALYLDNDLEKRINEKGKIVSCPKSNALLSRKMGKNQIIATDGKSSNNNVSLLDEIRVAFFYVISKSNDCIESIAQNIIKAVTLNPAKAMGINSGALMPGNDVDIAIFKFNDLNINNNVATNFLLNSKKAHKLIINGQNILI